MFGKKTPLVILLIASVFTFALVKDVRAETVNIVTVNSTHCEPVYNEATGTLYVPRCYVLAKQKMEEKEQGVVGRTTERAIEQGAQEIENHVNQNIDRGIRKIGIAIDKALGAY